MIKIFYLFITLIIILTQSCAIKQKNIVQSSYNSEINSILKVILGKKPRDTVKIQDYFIKKDEVLTYLENQKKFDDLMGHCIEDNKIIYFDSIFNFNEKNFKHKINPNILTGLKAILMKSDQNTRKLKLLSPIIVNNKALIYSEYPDDETLLILKKRETSWKLICRKSIKTSFVNPVIEKN